VSGRAPVPVWSSRWMALKTSVSRKFQVAIWSCKRLSRMDSADGYRRGIHACRRSCA
jgi:hypothetical protein